jgi:hypothetical protein
VASRKFSKQLAANLCFELEATFIAETDPNLFSDDPNPPPLCPGASKHKILQVWMTVIKRQQKQNINL